METVVHHATDREALCAAFDELKEQGFATQMADLCCSGCALAQFDADGVKDGDPFVFFHEQDEESFEVLSQPSYEEEEFEDAETEYGDTLVSSMYLGWGSSVKHGKTAVSILEKHGFTVSWDGTTDQRILIEVT